MGYETLSLAGVSFSFLFWACVLCYSTNLNITFTKAQAQSNEKLNELLLPCDRLHRSEVQQCKTSQ